MVKFILIKSPDEWATTKQACRDELVVYLSFSSIYTTLYFYVLSTVLRKSSFTRYIYIYIYIYTICTICIQCALPVVTIMALWQLLNLGTGCTVTHCWIALWSHKSAQTASSERSIMPIVNTYYEALHPIQRVLKLYEQ